MERGTHCAELISSIESIYNHQKERYNEQLRLLYELSTKYTQQTGIHPISGKKLLDLSKVSEYEFQYITKASRDSYTFPLSIFEQTLLDCIDPQTHSISSIHYARKFMKLLREPYGIGERYYLIEMIHTIKNQQVLAFLYAHGLQEVLFRYLDENCDIVTNYDYILFLLGLLAVIPLPSSINSRCIHLDYLLHCGDPDIEDLAEKVREHWTLLVCKRTHL